jgi:hypothetical protein
MSDVNMGEGAYGSDAAANDDREAVGLDDVAADAQASRDGEAAGRLRSGAVSSGADPDEV